MVATKLTTGRTFILTPKNEDTARHLSSTNTLTSNKTVALQHFHPKEATRKCILMGFPLKLPLSLLENQHMVAAKRCYYRLLQTEIRQVLTIRGTIPAEINLKNFGTYKTHNYAPEPLWCFKCRRFRQHKEKCRAPPQMRRLCGQQRDRHLPT